MKRAREENKKAQRMEEIEESIGEKRRGKKERSNEGK